MNIDFGMAKYASKTELKGSVLHYGRTYQISALFTGLSVIDNVYLASQGVSRGRYSLLRPRRSEPLMQVQSSSRQAGVRSFE